MRNRRAGQRGYVVLVVLVAFAAFVSAGCGSEPANDDVSTRDLHRAIPSAEEVGAVFGSSTMERADPEPDEGGWGFDDTFDRPAGCDEALRDLGDPESLLDVMSAGRAAHVEQAFTDDDFVEVTVALRSGGDGLVNDIERFVNACSTFEVRGRRGAWIRSGRYEEIEPVAVEGEAVAFEQTFVYTNVDNTYGVQVWSRGGVTVFVTAFSGLDDQRRPIRIARDEFEDLVRRVDEALTEVLAR